MRRQPVYQKLAARANLTSSSACRNMEDLFKIHNRPDSDHRPTTHARLAHCAAFGCLGRLFKEHCNSVLLGRHAVFMQAFRGINHEVAVDAAHVLGQLPLARVGRRLFYLYLISTVSTTSRCSVAHDATTVRARLLLQGPSLFMTVGV